MSKLNRTDSSSNVQAARNHQRKKSGASTPGHSPKSPGLPKRNSSHVALPKNTSHGNLRKNHSATVLTARQGSHANLKRLGLPPTPKAKDETQKTGFFELADQSSGEEEEGEWEDSTTQSPELTRNNSKASTPARVATPNDDRPSARFPVASTQRTRSPSPGSDVLKTNHRSMPALRHEAKEAENMAPQDPEFLQARRGSRAPPAMSTISAIAGLNRSDSNKSFQHVHHSEAASMNVTPNISVEGSSSADKAVSRFLRQSSASSETKAMIDDGSDEESVNFLNNYKPQPSESPEKPRHMHNARFSSMPSRTQQKLELERREMLRTGGGPATPPAATLAMGGPSTLSLHSRSGSRGRNRSFIDESKAIRVSYETGVRQLIVVRRFRNPIVDSFARLRDAGIIPAGTGVVTPGAAASIKTRPQSRRGDAGAASTHGSAKKGVSRSLDENQPSPLASRSSSRGRNGRVHFQRQGSHDDIGVTPLRGSFDGTDDEDNGMSPEEALMRRIWNSREVYEAAEATA